MSDIVTPWGPVGYITYKRTYARRLKENDLEKWIDIMLEERDSKGDQK